MSDCSFCRIVNGEIPVKEVARSAGAVAFHDLNPQAPVHLLVVPVTHSITLRRPTATRANASLPEHCAWRCRSRGSSGLPIPDTASS